MDKCEDKTYKCDEGTTKCVIGGDDFYCDCLPNFVLLDQTKDKTKNKDKCRADNACASNPCPSKSTKCELKEDNKNYYCACLAGYKLKDDIKEEKDNKQECLSTYVCEEKNCNKTNSQCIPKGNDYYCKCLTGYELGEGQVLETNKENCLSTFKCKDDTCPKTTKCQPYGDKYFCECLTGYQLKKGKDRLKNKDACDSTFVCENNPDNTCDIKTTKCVPSGNTFYCKCQDGYKLKEGKSEETNRDACLKKTKCDDPKIKCDSKTTTECVPKGDNDYYCKCKDSHKPANKVKDTDNKGACIEKTKCDDGTYNCDKETTECVMIGEDDFYCKCLPKYVLQKDQEVKKNKLRCISGCDKNFCQNSVECKPKNEDYECVCKPFFASKNCTTVSCQTNPCQNGGKCETKGEKDAKIGSCNCKSPFTGDLCETNSWCDKGFCGSSDDVECKFSVQLGVGYCSCKNDTLRFNYESKVCEDTPACLGINCKENEVCNPETKKCELRCKVGLVFDKESQSCKSNLCDDACFPESSCKVIGNVAVKCFCNETHYYASNECKDDSCLIPTKRKDCKEDCPRSDMKRDEAGQCKQVETENEKETGVLCAKNCGNFGYCYNNDTCLCIEEAVENDKGDCVLKPSVCPTGVSLTEDKLKCDCKGKFRESKNKITCDRKSCSDKDVQEEALKKNAVCIDGWQDKESFTLKCRDGYIEDKHSKICVDKTSVLDVKALCSTNNKVAFLNENGDAVCMCPPGIVTKPNNAPCDEKHKENTTYLIHDLPISKTKYVQNSKVDVISLTKDVILAMKQTFGNLLFARLFKYNLKEDVVSCSVWLQFNDPSEFDYNRIPLAAFDNGILLPGLQLKKEKYKEVKGANLKFCSGEENDPFCGSTKCKNNECKCDSGYRVVDASIKQYNELILFNCEDINECKDGTHSCNQETTTCVNTEGSYYCKCLSQYKLKTNKAEGENKEPCVDLCTDPNPCNKGKCSLHKNNLVECSCNVGTSGSYCDKNDMALAGANKKTVIVGAVLGTFLGIFLLGAAFYIYKQRKNSYSEDFSPAPARMDNAEMTERRPMRGISNRAYQ